jgi:hypothetical protein
VTVSLRLQRVVRTPLVVLVALSIAVSSAGAAVPSRGSKTPKPLCEFVSSGSNTHARDAATVDATQARALLKDLRKAAKLSVPSKVAKGIKNLIPLFERLANGDRIDDMATLQDYAAKQCAPSVETVDACALVTQADAEALAGTPFDPPVKSVGTCAYSTPATGPTRKVEVYLGEKAKSYYDVDRRLGHEFTPIDDLGDEAYIEPVQNIIFFRKSGLWVAIGLIRLDNDAAANNGPLETLARKVADKV